MVPGISIFMLIPTHACLEGAREAAAKMQETMAIMSLITGKAHVVLLPSEEEIQARSLQCWHRFLPKKGPQSIMLA